MKNLSKLIHYLSNLWTNISGIKRIVYQAKKIGIQSHFISIRFKIDRVVHAWPNIAVTYFPAFEHNTVIRNAQINLFIWRKQLSNMPRCLQQVLYYNTFVTWSLMPWTTKIECLPKPKILDKPEILTCLFV